MGMSFALVFKVERKQPELVRPARQTPFEFKTLSDIDDHQRGLRMQMSAIQFYRNNGEMQGRDPTEVIKEAIAKTLVYYYPFAGRLRERADGKLIVECNGEGVMFVEAIANVSLAHFGALLPPFSGAEDLLYDVPGSAGILHCPLLLIQVTHLTCGRFTLGYRLNHSMADGVGLVQLMTAAGELARGAHVPSVQPIWKRELLDARYPPRISCVHHVYSELQGTNWTPMNEMVDSSQRHFFFGSQELATLKTQVPLQLQKSSKFDIISACLWRCRTSALNLEYDEEVPLALNVDARAKFNPLLVGYYGSAVGLPIALSTAGTLCQNPLGYALELVKTAKATVTEEFMRSTADLVVKRGRPLFTTAGTYVVSDLTRMGFSNIHFRWGKAVYGGPIWGTPITSFFLPFKNSSGEEGIVVTIELPGDAMERLATEIRKMISKPINDNSSFIVSLL